MFAEIHEAYNHARSLLMLAKGLSCSRLHADKFELSWSIRA